MGKLTSKGKHTINTESHPHTNISKPVTMRRGAYKCRILGIIPLKLRGQHLKTVCVCVWRERERCVGGNCMSNPYGNYKPKIYNIKKAIYDKHVFKSEKLKAFPLKSGRRQECPLSPLLFRIILEVPAMAIREEK